MFLCAHVGLSLIIRLEIKISLDIYGDTHFCVPHLAVGKRRDTTRREHYLAQAHDATEICIDCSRYSGSD